MECPLILYIFKIEKDQNSSNIFLFNAYFNSFSVHDGIVHFQNGSFNCSRGWQFGHTNIYSIGPFSIQHYDLTFLNNVLSFLKDYEKIKKSNKKKR